MATEPLPLPAQLQLPRPADTADRRPDMGPLLAPFPFQYRQPADTALLLAAMAVLPSLLSLFLNRQDTEASRRSVRRNRLRPLERTDVKRRLPYEGLARWLPEFQLLTLP